MLGRGQTTAVCAALALGCASCSLGGGGAGGAGATGATAPTTATAASNRSISAAVSGAESTHELPTPVPRQTVIGGWPTPVQAVRAFATTYINWTAATVSLRLRTLALVSVGQARSAVTLAAAQTASDYELRRGGIANQGVVEAIAPAPGAQHRYVVVTRERTTSSDSAAYRALMPAWHVTLATVAEIQGGHWVVSSWQPQS
ncbi:MAG: hypothetical protein ACRDMX_08655 [Solirubrobacteraceae bacterium]